MKFGMNLYVWTTNLTPDFFYLFPMLKKLGYEGVEVPVTPDNDNVYDEIKRRLDGEGLACTSITNVGADADPISPDASVRRRALDRLRWAIDISRLLGSENLVGPYFAAYGVFSGTGPTEDELRRSADVMREAALYAQNADLTLSIEFLNRFEIYLLNTTAQARALVDRVGQPNFGILYDTHHAHHEEDRIADAITQDGGSAITHVHFSENQRGTLGSGLVDWQGTVKALKATNYHRSDRWVMAEAFNKNVPGLAEAAHVWRNCFDSPEQFAQDAIAFLRTVWEK
jgi:D-psicose/D-tagatose/L-ribulose 3-epimerase